jgi:hypothetical protein
VHERGVPSWERDAQARTDYGALSWRQLNVRSREQVAASVARVGALRQRQIRIEPHDQDLDGSGLGASTGHVTILRELSGGHGHAGR